MSLVALRQTLHSWPVSCSTFLRSLIPSPQSLKHPTPRRHVEECRLDLLLVIFRACLPCIWGRLGWPSPPDYDHHDTNFNQQGELRLVSDIAHLQAEALGPFFILSNCYGPLLARPTQRVYSTPKRTCPRRLLTPKARPKAEPKARAPEDHTSHNGYLSWF